MIEIVANKICKSYRTNYSSIQVLDDFSLEISRGEVIALLGPNGCGKSTFLEIVSGLIFPDSGEIILNGCKLDEHCQEVALVFQKYALFTWLTVIENLQIVLETKKFPHEEWQSRSAKYLKMFGLSNFSKMYPNQLSGGMQQKLALARALISEPKLLLLDEPFAALDAITRRELKILLINLIKESKMTVLLVTHSITEAIAMANRIIILSPRPGQVIDVLKLPGSPSILRIGSNESMLIQNKIWNTLYHNIVTITYK